ncbi:MAG TPA: hypothetical protein VGR72_13685 [Candidatus Acidoferrales bacterium]|nr:hypothetical protein [Candidatus Acidoferrales bacterium]
MKKKRPTRSAAHQSKIASRANGHLCLAGVELCFDNFDAAKEFYRDRLGLELREEQPKNCKR